MEAPLVGVQGHQKQWENTKVLMEIDVFVCLVVQEPGVPGGFAPPDPPQEPPGGHECLLPQKCNNCNKAFENSVF